MALTNLDKETTSRLFHMLSLNENNDIEIIKKNYSSYSKLELLAKQISFLQQEASNVINECKINDKLHNIPMTSKKVHGKYYYHYVINDKEVLSIIAPDEWNTYDNFLGKYLYNYDGLFYIDKQ